MPTAVRMSARWPMLQILGAPGQNLVVRWPALGCDGFCHGRPPKCCLLERAPFTRGAAKAAMGAKAVNDVSADATSAFSERAEPPFFIARRTVAKRILMERTMAKVLVLYYSSWGHMEQMAKSAAEGARSRRPDVTIKRVPELVPEAVAQGRLLQARPGSADRRPAGTRRTTTPSSSACRRASATWRRSSRISSTRPGRCG